MAPGYNPSRDVRAYGRKLRLKSNLPAETVTYVLRELAKARSTADDTSKGR
jgi:hypothetical protein